MKKTGIKKLKKILGKRIIQLFYRSLFFLSDESYIKLIYRLRMGKKLSLNPPLTFNEKLQYLKLYDHRALYTTLADKLSVRDYIDEKIGSGHSVPLLGVWSKVDEIDFSSLPSSFVLKTNHDSGNYIINDGSGNFDIKKAKRVLSSSLRHNYYRTTREWQYKNIEPKIIAEKYLGKDITDYKFFVFNGKAKFMYIEKESSSHPEQAIYDMAFNRLDFSMDDDISSVPFVKPHFFEEMKSISERLSSSLPFLRVDMYYCQGKVLVGELTLYHYGGFIPFNPPETDKKIGELLNIDDIWGK